MDAHFSGLSFDFSLLDDSYRFATILIGIYALVDSLEQLVFWKARRPGEALCWKYPDESYRLNRFRFLEWIFDHPASNIGLLVRAVSGGAVIVLALGGDETTLFLWLLLITQVQNNVLHRFRLYPAMHRTMGLIVLGGLALPAIASESPLVQEAGVWFIGLQAAMAYCFSGFRKIEQKEWRQGNALFHSFAKGAYQNLTFVKLIGDDPNRWKLMAWAVMVFELSFPLALVLPTPLSWGILFAGLLFHLSIHALIGLTHFFWTFVATYGAILYINGWMPWN